MIIHDAIEYLQVTPPFQALEEPILRDISDSLSIETYPRGTTIISNDGLAQQTYRVIQKGSVKVFIRTDKNEEVLVEYLGEGDSFGYPSLSGEDFSRTQVVAMEDTTCYQLDRDTILNLFKSHPRFAEHFFLSCQRKTIDRPYRELKKSKLMYGGGDRLLFSTPIGQLVTRELIMAPEDISIRDASALMTKNRSDSLILLDTVGLPTGIITDKDLRERVITKNRDVNQPASTIQSISLVKAEANEPCIEALYKMALYNIHHLLVLNNGQLKGVITSHDLMMLQGTSPLTLVREIEGNQDLQHLSLLSRKIEGMNRIFLQEGVRPINILRIMTEIKDRMLWKMMELIERKVGPAPLPYCLLAIGSAGRKEEAFSASYDARDIALIYADPVKGEEEKRCQVYFTKFCSQLREGLLKIGDFPAEKASMNGSPYTCQALTAWENAFLHWITRSKNEELHKLPGFFDFRPLYGEFVLSETLRDSVKTLIQGKKSFLGSLALMMLKNSPPIRFFNNFVVEKNGAHRDQFDLVSKGLTPLVDMIRFFALEKGVTETSTLERIQSLKSCHPMVTEWADELEYAFEFIMGLTLNHAFELREKGNEFQPFINPDQLNNLEKKTLREAFGLIAKLQLLLLEKYQPIQV